MNNIAQILAAPAPRTLAAARARFPQRDAVHASPADWRDEVLYFLLTDRFSDGREHTRPTLDRARLGANRAAYAQANGLPEWRWDRWMQSGKDRFQVGTLRGILSKLPYLAKLGVTTLWIAPVLRQRVEGNDFHGYGVQDFLDVEPRCGAITDPRQPLGPDDYVWPQELQFIQNCTRAGTGSLGAGDIRGPRAEHKRTDFEVLRDLAVDRADTLTRLVFIYQ